MREGAEGKHACVRAAFHSAKRQDSKHTLLANVGWRISLWWLERGTIIERAYLVGFAPPPEGVEWPSLFLDVGAGKDALMTCHSHSQDVDSFQRQESRWVGPGVVTLMKPHTYEVQVCLIRKHARPKAEAEHRGVQLLADAERADLGNLSNDIQFMAS